MHLKTINLEWNVEKNVYYETNFSLLWKKILAYCVSRTNEVSIEKIASHKKIQTMYTNDKYVIYIYYICICLNIYSIQLCNSSIEKKLKCKIHTCVRRPKKETEIIRGGGASGLQNMIFFTRNLKKALDIKGRAPAPEPQYIL